MIRNFKELDSYTTKDKSEITEIFHPNNSQLRNCSLALALVRPGEETILHKHTCSEEIYFILEGEGCITVGSKKNEVMKDDSILLKPGIMHKIKNCGENDLKILCISSPAYRHDDTLL